MLVKGIHDLNSLTIHPEEEPLNPEWFGRPFFPDVNRTEQLTFDYIFVVGDEVFLRFLYFNWLAIMEHAKRIEQVDQYLLKIVKAFNASHGLIKELFKLDTLICRKLSYDSDVFERELLTPTFVWLFLKHLAFDLYFVVSDQQCNQRIFIRTFLEFD